MRVQMGRCRSSAAILAWACSVAGEARDSAGRCTPPRSLPPAPRHATDLNGIKWPDLCFEGGHLGKERHDEEHFFVIGDWGGVFRAPSVPPMPANQAASRGRPFVVGVDDRAQQLVAAQMKARANASRPQFVINAGDNFYWGGVETDCGHSSQLIRTGQWEYVFEAIYTGPDLAGKQWMGVLGNHDYGGWMFTAGWDQAVTYTWGPGKRWLTPALYWSRHVSYPDFTVDMFFVDSNVNDAHHPMAYPNTNMCSMAHNPVNASCGKTGPSSIWDCVDWFRGLWDEQIPWLEAGLSSSSADWQVVVTHFPPDFQISTWAHLAETYGIDLIVAGHRHQQEVHYEDGFAGGVLGSTAWVVSGGGGGITSEGTPRLDGQDDMYGFMDIAISKHGLRIDAISHGGVLRSSTKVLPRQSLAQLSTTSTLPIGRGTTTTTSTMTSRRPLASVSSISSTFTSTVNATSAPALTRGAGSTPPLI